MCPLCGSEYIEIRFSKNGFLELKDGSKEARTIDDCYCFTCKQFYTEYSNLRERYKDEHRNSD